MESMFFLSYVYRHFDACGKDALICGVCAQWC